MTVRILLGEALQARKMELESGERVIFQGHPSWRSILGFYL